MKILKQNKDKQEAEKTGKISQLQRIFRNCSENGQVEFSLHSEISLCSENCPPTVDKQTRTASKKNNKKKLLLFSFFILLLLLYFIYIYKFFFFTYIFIFII